MREAIQLQFGPISNLIGSQFLDLLISGPATVPGDVLAHHVMLHGTEPRVVAFDLQSSFQQPVLNPNDKDEIDTWVGKRVIHNLPASKPALEGLESWTRALSKSGIRLGPRNQVRLPNASGDLFQNGLELVGQVLDDATDPVRRQIEKCDMLETIHTLADVDSLHGAVASVVLEQIRDDFCTSRQSLVTLPIWSSAGPTSDADAAVNRLLACLRLHECSNALVFNREPIVDLSLDTVMQALALYTGSVCYRRSSNGFSSGDLLRSLVFDPSLPFVSLHASLENAEPTAPRCTRRYRIAMGSDADDAECQLANQISVPIGSPLAEGVRPPSRHARRVSRGAVAEWTSAEPVFDRVLRLARSAQMLNPAMAAARYSIETDALDHIRESYLGMSDSINSYRTPGF